MYIEYKDFDVLNPKIIYGVFATIQAHLGCFTLTGVLKHKIINQGRHVHKYWILYHNNPYVLQGVWPDDLSVFYSWAWNMDGSTKYSNFSIFRDNIIY